MIKLQLAYNDNSDPSIEKKLHKSTYIDFEDIQVDVHDSFLVLLALRWFVTDLSCTPEPVEVEAVTTH